MAEQKKIHTSHAHTIDPLTHEEFDETVYADFPYRACNGYLSRDFINTTYPWHWHNDVEFFFMQKGSIVYNIPGNSMEFNEGDAGFLNATVMHQTEWQNHKECVQQMHIFLPDFLTGGKKSRIDSQYIYPLSSDRGIKLIRFKSGTLECKEAIHLMQQAFDLYTAKTFGYEIEIRSYMTRLWLITLRHCSQLGLRNLPESVDTIRIRKMASYIDSHYGEHITLLQIAKAANIGERECCRCFARQLKTSPMEYLLDIRVNRAKRLLLTSDESIERIAEQCGFSSGSYFGKVFRKRTGQSPKEFRISGIPIPA